MHASRKRKRRANESENDNKIQFINIEILSKRLRVLNECFKIFFIKDFIYYNFDYLLIRIGDLRYFVVDHIIRT